MPTPVAQAIWSAELQRAPLRAFYPWLQSELPAVRARAVLAVGRLKREDATPVLESLLRDPAREVRASAAFALGLIPRTGGILVQRFFQETDPEVRASLIGALGQQGGPEAVHPLVEALGSENAEAAVLALGRMGMRRVRGIRDAEVTAALLSQFRTMMGKTRVYAAWALGKTGVGGDSPDVRDHLLSIALHDIDPQVRTWMVSAWANIALASQRSEGWRLLREDRSPTVRIAVARSIGLHGCEKNQDLLPPLLNDPDDAVRLAAIDATRSCTVDPALLQKRLPSASPEEQAALLLALSHAHALSNPSAWTGRGQPLPVRRAAVQLSTDPRFLLQTALHGDTPSLRDTALDALLHLRPPPELLLELLTASDEAILQHTAEALGSLLPPKFDRRRLLAPLLAALSRPRLTAPTVEACFSALPPAPEARETVRRWLELFPFLAGKNPELLRALHLDAPAPRPLYIPPLADVMLIRSARILTEAGEIRIRLLPELAPYAVWNFAWLAEQGYLNGRNWNRVLPDFIAQTGDPRGDGWGGPGYSIPDELSDAPFVAGTVAMASAGPDTSGSQWFITLSDQPSLLGSSTVFGSLSFGKTTLLALREGDRVDQVVIERVAAVAGNP